MDDNSPPSPIIEALQSQVKQAVSECISNNANCSTGYPESLLIYHAGIGRTVFVGCLKLTTIILFVGSCVVIAPSYYRNDHEPNWMAVAGMYSRSFLS